MLIQLVSQSRCTETLAESSSPTIDASSALFGNTGAVILNDRIATSVLAN